ncbi:MAG: NAD(P)/FAD-dependent oxidoreductase [Candidatus Njordarchaeales archaeon]
MEEITKELIIVGAGLAGSYLGIKASEYGFDNVLIIEREPSIGGILRHLRHVNITYPDTGEEIAPQELLMNLNNELQSAEVEIWKETTVIDLQEGFKVICVNPNKGVTLVNAEKVVLATGGKEINQYDLRIVGSRPAGVFTALLAIKLVDLFNKRIGRDVVIYGDNELVKEVVTRLKGLGSNIKYLVTDKKHRDIRKDTKEFIEREDIEIIDYAQVIRLHGVKRLERIEVMKNDSNDIEEISCDTLIISKGFLPDLILIKKVGAGIDFSKLEPIKGENLETTIKDLFVAGLAAERKESINDILKSIPVIK